MPKIKGLLYIFSFFIFVATATGQVSGSESSEPRPYTGYRLHLSGIAIEQEDANHIWLSFTAINTGKYSFSSKDPSIKESLILNADFSNSKLNLSENDPALIQALFEKKIELEPGGFEKLKGIQISKLRNNTVPEIVQLDRPKNLEEARDSLKKKPDSSNKTKEKGDNIVFQAPEIDRQSLEEILEEKNTCPDLVFDTIVLLKRTERSAWVEFTIKNIGKGDAEIYNENNGESSFGIRAYISGSTFISKGSVTIGGIQINDGLEEKKGILKPGQKHTMQVQFDIRKMTRYMPVLILSLDAFLKLRECDRTNNTGHLIFD
jgi:hypothetical protein